MAEDFVTYDQIENLDSGHYRVRFENRSQWNCDLVVASDGIAIFWIDYKNGNDRDREFPLIADDQGIARATKTPKDWGRMTRIVAR